MKIHERQQGRHGAAICAIALLGAPLLLYISGRLAIEYIPKLGLGPCEEYDGLTRTAHGLEAFLLIVAIWLQVRVFRHPSYVSLIAALLAPLAAWLIQDTVNDRDALRQRQCAARPLTEAMKACGANPAHYRLGTDKYGYDMLTVIAPGTTDQAWSCLSRWSDHNGTVSINVDESVYREYRRANSNQN